MEPVQIIPRLFLGPASFACDPQWLRDNAVALVINCSQETATPESPLILAVRLFVDGVRDAPETFTAHLPNLVELMHTYIAQEKTVFVHGLQGLQRSAALVCAYLVKHSQHHINSIIPLKSYTMQYLLDKAIQFLLDRQPLVFCKGERIDLAPALKKYDKDVFLSNVWNKAWPIGRPGCPNTVA